LYFQKSAVKRAQNKNFDSVETRSTGPTNFVVDVTGFDDGVHHSETALLVFSGNQNIESVETRSTGRTNFVVWFL
jgi:hypothetical protein